MTVGPWVKTACIGVSLSALAMALAGAAAAQTSKPAHKPAAASSAPAAPTIEPAALAALQKMSEYLRGMPAFQVKMQTQRDDVDVYDQLVTLNGSATFKVKRPNTFSIEVVRPFETRQYVYDGKSVTVYDPSSGYYATFPAPATIRATLDLAADKYGVEVPLEDLFHWGENSSLAAALTSAHVIGPSVVDGEEAVQYAFRQPGVDWQIWVAKGDKPVPLRVVIVATDDPAKPQFEADLTWDDAPQFAADTFTFTPPANAKSIPIQSAAR